MSKSETITTTEAAQALGISPQRVRVLIKNGRLPTQLLGGMHLIQRADLKLVRNRKPGRPPKQ